MINTIKRITWNDGLYEMLKNMHKAIMSLLYFLRNTNLAPAELLNSVMIIMYGFLFINPSMNLLAGFRLIRDNPLASPDVEPIWGFCMILIGAAQLRSTIRDFIFMRYVSSLLSSVIWGLLLFLIITHTAFTVGFFLIPIFFFSLIETVKNYTMIHHIKNGKVPPTLEL